MEFKPGKMNRPNLYSSMEDCKQVLENGFLAQKEMSEMTISDFISRAESSMENASDAEKQMVEEAKQYLLDKYKS